MRRTPHLALRAYGPAALGVRGQPCTVVLAGVARLAPSRPTAKRPRERNFQKTSRETQA
jgi:hypothetical protein